MKSISLIAIVAPRTTLTFPGMVDNDSTKIRFHNETPKTETIAIISTKPGIAMKESTTRCIEKSVFPPTYPDRRPTAVPNIVLTQATASPMMTGILAPHIIRDRMSRPCSSDPRT